MPAPTKPKIFASHAASPRRITYSKSMLWTSELAEYLEDAPWPANKAELIDYCERIGAPPAVVKNLEEIEDEDEQFESIQEIWPDYSPEDDEFYYDDELNEY
jgi:hypothetical protein